MNVLFLNSINIGGLSDFDSDIVRVVLLIAIPLVIIQLILLITALVSLVKKQVHATDKVIWGLVIVFINIFGPIVYFAFGSNYLDQKAAELEDSREKESGQQ
jgi:hypothetical protein